MTAKFEVGQFATWRRWNWRRTEYRAIEAVVSTVGWLGWIQVEYTTANGSIRSAWTRARDLTTRQQDSE
jgi:hypothetical protein